MRAGRVEKASTLAARIGGEIAAQCKMRLSKVDGKVNTKDMWAAVRQLTGQRQNDKSVEGITATSLNKHYAAISNDTGYQPPVSNTLPLYTIPSSSRVGKSSNY